MQRLSFCSASLLCVLLEMMQRSCTKILRFGSEVP
jgi:hypothetical protein